MSNAISTPRQTFTLDFSREDVESKIQYVCDRLPTYVFKDKNDALNSIRVEATQAIQTQHMDFRFQDSEEGKCKFELEISKSTGGMTDDDSTMFAKKNMEEFMDYLTKCLGGYEISDADVQEIKSAQSKNVILYIIVFVLIMIWIFAC